MKLQTKCQRSVPSSIREENICFFPYISLCKTNDPWGRAIFDLRTTTILVEVHKIKLHSKYQRTRRFLK